MMSDLSTIVSEEFDLWFTVQLHKAATQTKLEAVVVASALDDM